MYGNGYKDENAWHNGLAEQLVLSSKVQDPGLPAFLAQLTSIEVKELCQDLHHSSASASHQDFFLDLLRILLTFPVKLFI